MDENKFEETKKETIDKAQDALNRLSQGTSTINQIRDEYCIKPIQYELMNELITKVQFDNNMELD